jgi:hypothetical protein
MPGGDARVIPVNLKTHFKKIMVSLSLYLNEHKKGQFEPASSISVLYYNTGPVSI